MENDCKQLRTHLWREMGNQISVQLGSQFWDKLWINFNLDIWSSQLMVQLRDLFSSKEELKKFKEKYMERL